MIIPDLLGHGESAKPRGDYSLGAYASGVRDLLIALDIERATVVGHSLGGGVAMQFAYQFPERIERLGLVSSGGLGQEVSMLLRSATLPGAEYVLPLLCAEPFRNAGASAARFLGRVGLRPGPPGGDGARLRLARRPRDPPGLHPHCARDHGHRRAARSARDRLYLAAEVPTLLIWGMRDRMIPSDHGRTAHESMPGSRFLLYEKAGHFPHRDEPLRFAADLLGFVHTTAPAEVDLRSVRELIQRGVS